MTDFNSVPHLLYKHRTMHYPELAPHWPVSEPFQQYLAAFCLCGVVPVCFSKLGMLTTIYCLSYSKGDYYSFNNLSLRFPIQQTKCDRNVPLAFSAVGLALVSIAWPACVGTPALLDSLATSAFVLLQWKGVWCMKWLTLSEEDSKFAIILIRS